MQPPGTITTFHRQRGRPTLSLHSIHNGAARHYHIPPKPSEDVRELIVRVRTIGDIISTGLVESPAATVSDIIAEIAAARVTERGSRADDKASEAAMEDRKKAGYF